MKKRLCALLLGTMMLIMTACGASSDMKSAAESPNMMSVAGAAGMEEGISFDSAMEYNTTAETQPSEPETATTTNRKLIKTVSMSVETKEYEELFQDLQTRVESLGGYIESMDVYNGSIYSDYRRSRNAYMCIRIPENQLDTFLNAVTDISNVTNRSDNVEDVTLQYVDLESHRNVLRTEQTRLLQLLEQAETIEDIITIEERLSNIRYQLESMESQLRTLDNQVDYSTVYLDINEVQELTPVSEETTWERISGGFIQSLKDVGYDVKETFIWVVVNLPYLVIWAVIILLVVLIIRKVRKIRKGRKQKKILAQSANMKKADPPQGSEQPK